MALPSDYQDDWFTVAFDNDYEQIYRRTDDTALREVEGVLRYLAVPKRTRRYIPLLDLGCGWGRHAVPLARRGYAVTGLDLSQAMLSRARERAEHARMSVTQHDALARRKGKMPKQPGIGAMRLVHADMRKIPFSDEFDVVVNLFTSFGYFPKPADNLTVLAGVYRALRPGGKLLIDVNNPQRYVSDEVGNSTVVIADARGDAHVVDREERFDLKRNRRVVNYRFRDKQRKPIYLECELYDRDDLHAMLEGQGFEVHKETWGDFDGMRYSDASPRLIMVAQRPE